MWILIVVIIIGGCYFLFLKPRNKNASTEIGSSNNSFVGRYQQLCLFRKFLGEDVPELELQIAINKDKDERDKIVEKLEESKGYMKSDLFTNHFDVNSIFQDMRRLTDEGYGNCVLKNDSNLEAECLKILDDTIKYLQKYLRESDEFKGKDVAKVADDLDSIVGLSMVQGVVSYATLGGLLNENLQDPWAIMNSALYSNKLVRDSLSLFEPKVANEMAEKKKKAAETLFANNKITASNLKKIEEEIKEGLALSKKRFE